MILCIFCKWQQSTYYMLCVKYPKSISSTFDEEKMLMLEMTNNFFNSMTLMLAAAFLTQVSGTTNASTRDYIKSFWWSFNQVMVCFGSFNIGY